MKKLDINPKIDRRLFVNDLSHIEGGLRTKGVFKKKSTKPLITIITVVLNDGAFLEATIQSIISQSYKNVEYILIDGGSTDDTLNIIRNYDSSIDYWISGSDSGIYNAMNKGISLSTGEILYFLNSGDLLCPMILDIVYPYFTSDMMVVTGDVQYFPSQKIVVSKPHKLIWKNTIHHQSAFYSYEIFNRLGGYSQKFDILSDYHHNIRIYLSNIPIIKINQLIAICSDGGLSDVPNWKNYHEEISIRRSFYKRKYSFFFFFYSLVRFLIKRTVK